jgi:hypothetical protein
MWGWGTEQQPDRTDALFGGHACDTYNGIAAFSAPNVHGRVAASHSAYRREPNHPVVRGSRAAHMTNSPESAIKKQRMAKIENLTFQRERGMP